MTYMLGTHFPGMLPNIYSIIPNIYSHCVQHVSPNIYIQHISQLTPNIYDMLPNIYNRSETTHCCPTYMKSETLYMLGNKLYMLEIMFPNIYQCYPTYIGVRKKSPNTYLQHIYPTHMWGDICWVYMLDNNLYVLDDILSIYVGYICWVTFIYIG